MIAEETHGVTSDQLLQDLQQPTAEANGLSDKIPSTKQHQAHTDVDHAASPNQQQQDDEQATDHEAQLAKELDMLAEEVQQQTHEEQFENGTERLQAVSDAPLPEEERQQQQQAQQHEVEQQEGQAQQHEVEEQRPGSEGLQEEGSDDDHVDGDQDMGSGDSRGTPQGGDGEGTDGGVGYGDAEEVLWDDSGDDRDSISAVEDGDGEAHREEVEATGDQQLKPAPVDDQPPEVNAAGTEGDAEPKTVGGVGDADAAVANSKEDAGAAVDAAVTVQVTDAKPGEEQQQPRKRKHAPITYTSRPAPAPEDIQPRKSGKHSNDGTGALGTADGKAGSRSKDGSGAEKERQKRSSQQGSGTEKERQRKSSQQGVKASKRARSRSREQDVKDRSRKSARGLNDHEVHDSSKKHDKESGRERAGKSVSKADEGRLKQAENSNKGRAVSPVRHTSRDAEKPPSTIQKLKQAIQARQTRSRSPEGSGRRVHVDPRSMDGRLQRARSPRTHPELSRGSPTMQRAAAASPRRPVGRPYHPDMDVSPARLRHADHDVYAVRRHYADDAPLSRRPFLDDPRHPAPMPRELRGPMPGVIPDRRMPAGYQDQPSPPHHLRGLSPGRMPPPRTSRPLSPPRHLPLRDPGYLPVGGSYGSRGRSISPPRLPPLPRGYDSREELLLQRMQGPPELGHGSRMPRDISHRQYDLMEYEERPRSMVEARGARGPVGYGEPIPTAAQRRAPPSPERLMPLHRDMPGRGPAGSGDFIMAPGEAAARRYQAAAEDAARYREDLVMGGRGQPSPEGMRYRDHGNARAAQASAGPDSRHMRVSSGMGGYAGSSAGRMAPLDRPSGHRQGDHLDSYRESMGRDREYDRERHGPQPQPLDTRQGNVMMYEVEPAAPRSTDESHRYHRAPSPVATRGAGAEPSRSDRGNSPPRGRTHAPHYAASLPTSRDQDRAQGRARDMGQGRDKALDTDRRGPLPVKTREMDTSRSQERGSQGRHDMTRLDPRQPVSEALAARREGQPHRRPASPGGGLDRADHMLRAREVHGARGGEGVGRATVLQGSRDRPDNAAYRPQGHDDYSRHESQLREQLAGREPREGGREGRGGGAGYAPGQREAGREAAARGPMQAARGQDRDGVGMGGGRPREGPSSMPAPPGRPQVSHMQGAAPLQPGKGHQGMDAPRHGAPKGMPVGNPGPGGHRVTGANTVPVGPGATRVPQGHTQQPGAMQNGAAAAPTRRAGTTQQEPPLPDEAASVWFYLDPNKLQQGPCSVVQFKQWISTMKDRPELHASLQQFENSLTWSKTHPQKQPLHAWLRLYASRR